MTARWVIRASVMILVTAMLIVLVVLSKSFIQTTASAVINDVGSNIIKQGLVEETLSCFELNIEK